MTQVLTAIPMPGCAEPGEECYEVYWTIPNWLEVRKSESLVKYQEAVFETGSSPSGWFKTKWLVGLKLVPDGDSGKKIRPYWKLLEIQGSESTKVNVRLLMQLFYNRTKTYARSVCDITAEVKELEIVEGTLDQLQFKPEWDSTDGDYICPRGMVGFKLFLTLKMPTMSPSDYDRYFMENFRKTSVEQLLQDQVSLLYDHPENADLKFITSDDVEITAHKTILRARCPVFEGMLNCDLSENTTGIIQMTDITGKTMKILLHYFYTRELLPSWRDPDTVVEFVYAAGKYQMTEVLQLLDNLLGMNPDGDASHLDVELISLVAKLKLEKAETRLLRRIVAKIKNLTTGDQLFELFGYEEDGISEMVENLATEQVGQSRILRLMDSLYENIGSQDLYEKGMPLLAFVRKEGLKMVEKNLLKRLADLAAGMGNVTQLFTLFCRGKPMEREGVNAGEN